MRLFVLVLALVLLPLRGGLDGGIAMAMQEAAAATDACAQMQAMHHGTASAHAGGESARQAHAAPPACQAADTTHAHAPCGDCQLCHSVAPAAPLPVTARAQTPQAPPAFRAARFASAELSPALKPPIG